MGELFDKKEINPTVKVMISMNQEERNEFKAFAEQMDRMVPRGARMKKIKPRYCKGERGNKPYDPELTLL